MRVKGKVLCYERGRFGDWMIERVECFYFEAFSRFFAEVNESKSEAA